MKRAVKLFYKNISRNQSDESERHVIFCSIKTRTNFETVRFKVFGSLSRVVLTKLTLKNFSAFMSEM